MCSQLVVAVVVEALEHCFLDRAVHPLDLTVSPRKVGFGQPMFDPIGFADHVKAHWPGIDGVPVSRLLCELNAIIRENGVDLIGHGLQHVLQELSGGAPVSLFNKLGDGELARAVDADEEVKLALSGLHLCNINMKEPNRVAFELRAPRLVPLDIQQARDAFAIGLEPMAPQWLIVAGTGAALIASGAGSTVAGHRDNRPAATMYAAEMRQPQLPRLRSEPWIAVPSAPSSCPRPTRFCAISRRSWG